jgi:ornithine cyclodeaminase/alanine dehydrogenase-like protein (mu-crystallin family)
MVFIWHDLLLLKRYTRCLFKTSALSAVAVAKALPDDDARSGASELLHIGLGKYGKDLFAEFP